MLVTPLPIVTFVSKRQFMNACSPILITLSGIVTLVSELQPRNAYLPILVTLSGITRSVTSSPLRYKLLDNGLALGSANSILHQDAISVIYTSVSESQFWNAPLPILVTPLPIFTLVSEVQSLNA